MDEPLTLHRGRYRVLHVLSRRPYATVYEAQDTRSGELVAVKLLSLTGSHREVASSMFQKEVGALDGFLHDAVVKLIDRFTEPEADQLGIVLELVPGGRTLEALINDVLTGREPRRTLRWRLEQLRRILGALETAHQRNVIHRDVKPANILLDRDREELKLADFGVARLLENYARRDAGLTLREFYTRPFAAPEQVLTGEATFASDLHAFGLVAASLLGWRTPDRGFTVRELPALLASLRTEIRDPAVYGELEEVLQLLLSNEPTARPRAPSVDRVFRSVLERVAERIPANIILTTAVRSKLREDGLSSDAAILADINDAPRARYESSVDQRTGLESFKINCYGRTASLLLIPDASDPSRLKAVAARRGQPALHARDRDRALELPFRLVEGDRGDATPLIEFLYAAHQAEQRRHEEQRQKESLLEVARFVLDQQRSRLRQLKIRYRLERSSRGAPTTGFGAKLAQALGADGQAAQTPSEVVAITSDHVTLSVISVDQWDPDAEVGIASLGDNWVEHVVPGTVFLFEGVKLGAFHGYDPERRQLSLRLHRHADLPREGEIECKDVAQEAALRRQESAIDHFFEGVGVNARLGELLLFPERNRLREIVPRALLQALAPTAMMQSLVERALSADDFFFIQGPPGTGKTTLIAEMMAQLLVAQPETRILLTSQSNEAVTNALDALRGLGTQMGASWRLLRDVPAERERREPNAGFDASFRDWILRTRSAADLALADYERGADIASADKVRAALSRWSAGLDRVCWLSRSSTASLS